jgi:hypothetical protein
MTDGIAPKHASRASPEGACAMETAMSNDKPRLAADLFYAFVVIVIVAAGLAAGATTLDAHLSELAALIALV